MAALAVCAAGVGLAVSSLWKAPPPSQPKFVQRPLDAPQAPTLPRRVAAPSKSLVQATPTDLDALFDIFRDGPPSVKEFAAEFKAEPELKQAYDEFKADQTGPDPKQTLESFVHRLSEKAEFRALVSRFSQDPGFREAALKLANQSPQVAAAVKDIVASARSSRAGARSARASIIGGRVPSSGTQGFGGGSRGTAASARSGGAGPQTSAGPGGAGALAGGQAASSIGAAAGSGTGIGPGPGGGAKGSSSVPGPKGPEAHEVNPELGGIEEKPESEDMDKALKDWLAANGLDPNVYMAAQGAGIWDLCFTRKELAKCDAACNNQPKMVSTRAHGVCSKPNTPVPGNPYWNACLQAGISELDCIRECKAQDPPCRVDDGAIKKYCSPTPPGKCPRQCIDAGVCNAEAPRAPGKAAITYRCQEVGVSYNGSFWRWHPIGPCTDGYTIRCSKRDGNACPQRKGVEATVRCGCGGSASKTPLE